MIIASFAIGGMGLAVGLSYPLTMWIVDKLDAEVVWSRHE